MLKLQVSSILLKSKSYSWHTIFSFKIELVKLFKFLIQWIFQRFRLMEMRKQSKSNTITWPLTSIFTLTLKIWISLKQRRSSGNTKIILTKLTEKCLIRLEINLKRLRLWKLPSYHLKAKNQLWLTSIAINYRELLLQNHKILHLSLDKLSLIKIQVNFQFLARTSLSLPSSTTWLMLKFFSQEVLSLRTKPSNLAMLCLLRPLSNKQTKTEIPESIYHQILKVKIS